MMFLSGFGATTPQVSEVPPVPFANPAPTSSGGLLPRPFMPVNVPSWPDMQVSQIDVGPDLVPTATPAQQTAAPIQPAPTPFAPKPCTCAQRAAAPGKPAWWPDALPAPTTPTGWLLVGAGSLLVVSKLVGR